MAKSVVLALVSLGLILLTSWGLSPANATTSDVETYIWSFNSPGSHQLVCKQVVMHPAKALQRRASNEQVVKMNSASKIVSDRYCAHSAKPFKKINSN
jgi:hypothetical protein